jgi:DNA-binding NarL/FixJ family response regulator
MKTKYQVLELKNQGKNIPEICQILSISKGTVGFHLKNLGIKWDKKRTEEDKRKISEAQKGKPKKKLYNKNNKKYKKK